MQNLLTIDRLLIIILAAWYILLYVLNANMYIKRALGINTFVRKKPIDCYFCLNGWTVIPAYWFLIPDWETYGFYIAFHLLIAGCIQCMVEGRK